MLNYKYQRSLTKTIKRNVIKSRFTLGTLIRSSRPEPSFYFLAFSTSHPLWVRSPKSGLLLASKANCRGPHLASHRFSQPLINRDGENHPEKALQPELKRAHPRKVVAKPLCLHALMSTSARCPRRTT